MNTIFMNSQNSKTYDPHKLLLNLTDKIDLRGKDKQIALSNFKIKFKILVRTWNEEFELPDGSYSVPDIQDYLNTYIKKA